MDDTLPIGSFELAALRMSRYYDLEHESVLYGDLSLPLQAFMTSDTVEVKLVTSLFEFARGIAEMKLSDVQLGLYSAFILLAPGPSPSLSFFYIEFRDKLSRGE